MTPNRVPPTAQQRGKQVVVDEPKKKKKVRFFGVDEKKEFEEEVRNRVATGYSPLYKIKKAL